MGRKMIIISDDNEFIVAARSFCESRGGTCKVYSTQEWARQNAGHDVGGSVPLAPGQQPIEGAKILPFPGASQPAHTETKVHTINELEAVAIQNAIHNFNGNLTEAAKALGIGRATLYRKVKQYNIDPSMARKKRMAA